MYEISKMGTLHHWCKTSDKNVAVCRHCQLHKCKQTLHNSSFARYTYTRQDGSTITGEPECQPSLRGI